MKRFFVFVSVLLVAFSLCAQPKNIILVLVDGMGYNHAQIATSNQTSVFSNFDVNYAVCNYPTYWKSLEDGIDVEYARGDYHVRRVWQEFDYADNLPMSKITAGSALATGVKPALDAVSYDIDDKELETILERAIAKGKSTGIATNGDISDDNAVIPFATHKKVANTFDDYDNLFFDQLLQKDIDVVITSNFYGLESENWQVVTAIQNFPSSIEKKIFYGSETISQEDYNSLATKSLSALSANDKGFLFVSEFTDVAQAAEEQDVDATKTAMQNLESYVHTIYSWVEQNSSWDETAVFVVGTYEQGYVTSKHFDKTKPVNNYLAKNINDIQYNSEHATNLLTPLFAKGNGTEILHNYIDETDFVLGSYVSNTEIAQTIFRMMPNEQQVPKNIILMINDGCGLAPIQMADYYTGKTASYENFPVQMWNCTHASASSSSVNALNSWNNTYESRLAWTGKDYFWKRNNATCSGASGTALATGKKTYYYCLGVDLKKNALKSIARHAKEMGKSAGVATNAPFNDATPGAFFTNNLDRLESEALSRQVIIESNADVVIGANHPEFDKNAQPKAKPSYSSIGGKEMLDGLRAGATTFEVSTISGWSQVRDIDGDGQPDPWTFVEDSAGLVQYLSTDDVPKRLFAVMPVESSMQFYRTGINVDEVHFDDWNAGMPRLWQIGRTAINCLSKNDNGNGFFLMIEGDMVDNAGHKNQIGRHIEEQMEFNQTVDSVIAWIEKYSSWDETLLIVTADHETGFIADETFGQDSILLKHWQVKDNGVGNLPGIKYYSGDHSNQLVPFYAKGAGSDVFTRYADDWDFVRGKFLNNSEVGQSMFELWNGTACTFVNESPKSTYSDTIYLKQSVDFYIPLPKDIVFDAEDEPIIQFVSAPIWVEFDKENFALQGHSPMAKGVSFVTFSATDGATTGAGISVRFNVAICVYKEVVDDVEVVENENITIYPTISTQSITIKTEGTDGTIIVRNSLGRIVATETIKGNETTIITKNFAAGEYFVQIIEEENVTTKKFIVQ